MTTDDEECNRRRFDERHKSSRSGGVSCGQQNIADSINKFCHNFMGSHNLGGAMRQFTCIVILVFGVTTLIPAAPAAGHDKHITRLSIDSQGHEADGASSQPAISADGRFVAFTSTSSNLAPGQSPDICHILVHDRTTGATSLASVSTSGEAALDNCLYPTISDDGRFVAFASFASNLVEDDSNGRGDIFVHDRHTGETSRVSVSARGIEGNDHSSLPAISADGRFVAFSSDADSLVPSDTNGRRDIFVHDRHTSEVELVSIDANGNQGNSHSYAPDISCDGRFVAYYSHADNLVPQDSNRVTDIFVHDRQNHTTNRCSVDSNGTEADGYSLEPRISGDGQFIVFSSFAQNLVHGDTNRLRDVFMHDRVHGKTIRISNNSGSKDSVARCLRPSISADSRFITYIDGDAHIFLHDRANGSVESLTQIKSPSPAGWTTSHSAISGHGETVVFSSTASTLVPGDSNDLGDIFAVNPGAGILDSTTPLSGGANRQSRQPIKNACE
jgi:Tol biopolymer transport system component